MIGFRIWDVQFRIYLFEPGFWRLTDFAILIQIFIFQVLNLYDMENEFDAVMQKRTDAQLIKILNGPPDDYQPTAIDAAKREFERRNLSEAEITTATEEIEQEQLVDESKANMPLGIFPKIIAFIFPGILLIMFAGTYKADGYDRKAKEMVKWTLLGVAFYVSLVVLMIITALLFY